MPQDPYAAIAEDPYSGIAEGSTAQSTQAAPPKTFYQKLGPGGRALSSFESNFGIPESVQEHPSEALQGIKLAVMHPGLEWDSLKEMYNSMTGAQKALFDRGVSGMKSKGIGNKANGFAFTVYSFIPVAGPAVVSALDQWHSGDKAGALGSLAAIATQFAHPGEFKPGEHVAEKPPGKIFTAISDKVQPFARDVTEASRGAKEAVKGAIEKQTKVDETNTRIRGENADQASRVTKRGGLVKEVDQSSADLGKDLKLLENAVYKKANDNFEAIKSKIGNPQEPPDTLISSVRSAETDILQGVPENIKEFRRIVSMENTSEDMAKLRSDVMSGQGMSGKYEELSPERKAVVDDITKRAGGEISPNEPLTWGKLQSLKSRLDTRLRNSRGMNGDLKRALFSVRDSVVDEMGKMAQTAGVTDEWNNARAFYRQWREDFHEPTGPSGSGSPVAQALDAVDPDKIRQPFSRTQSSIGNRGLDILRRYGQFGGDKVADRVTGIISKQNEIENLPKVVKEKPLRPNVPPVDLNQAAKAKIEQTASRVGRLNAWDARIIASSVIAGVLAPFLGIKGGIELGASYVGMKMFLAHTLEKPKVIEWLAKTPQSEIDSLNKLPGIDKINVQHGLTEAAIELGRGKKITLSTELRRFLGPSNVARIVAAGSATKQRKEPGEQMKDLKAIQQYSNPNLPVGMEQ